MDSVMAAIRVQEECGIPVMPHISCRDRNKIAMRAQLFGAYANHIRQLLLVTGDPIPDSARGTISGVFDFHATELMRLVREMNIEHFSDEPFLYGGAINPARANLKAEILRVQKKMDAGASFFLTQPVFSDEGVERIQIIKERVSTKILCGIMPLVSYKNAVFAQNEITGIHVPDELVQRFSLGMSREEGEAVGTTAAKEIIRKLKTIADGYYIILPFNRISLMEECMKEIRS
jgi:homocysteine S-methyltransferase